jgi:peptidoglycan L-alanyl-D-glutamate endopeptidase CwlK
MGKELSELASYFEPLAEQLINLCQAAGINVAIIDTGRTPAEQEQKIAQGVSWVSRSKHEPQPPEGKSEAIDLCPVDYLSMKLWNPQGPLWAQMGAIGKQLGLGWGGDWKEHPDVGHFEYIHTTPQVLTDPELSTL